MKRCGDLKGGAAAVVPGSVMPARNAESTPERQPTDALELGRECMARRSKDGYVAGRVGVEILEHSSTGYSRPTCKDCDREFKTLEALAFHQSGYHGK